MYAIYSYEYGVDGGWCRLWQFPAFDYEVEAVRFLMNVAMKRYPKATLAVHKTNEQ